MWVRERKRLVKNGRARARHGYVWPYARCESESETQTVALARDAQTHTHTRISPHVRTHICEKAIRKSYALVLLSFYIYIYTRTYGESYL